MKVSYLRVSSTSQSLDVQRDAVKAYGAEKIFEEKVSGTSTKGRTQLAECLDFVRQGDELVITRIDRLARSVLDLQLIVKQLNEKGVTLYCTEQSAVDTKSAMGNMFINLLSVFASFETSLRAERQAEGILRAKSKGTYKGRKASIDKAVVKELHDSGLGASAIAKQLQIDRTSVYRVLR